MKKKSIKHNISLISNAIFKVGDRVSLIAGTSWSSQPFSAVKQIAYTLQILLSVIFLSAQISFTL